MKLYKKSFKGIALAAFSVLALSACSDWTDSESIKLKEPGIDEQSPELYAKYLKTLLHQLRFRICIFQYQSAGHS